MNIPLILSTIMIAIATAMAAKIGISRSEGLSMLAIAGLTFAATVYTSRLHGKQRESLRVVLAGIAAMSLVACLWFQINPFITLAFWFATSLPMFINQDHRDSQAITHSKRVFIMIESASIIAFAIGCLSGGSSVGGRIAFITAAFLRFGIFPFHLGSVGFIQDASLSVKLTHLINILTAITVSSSYLPSLLTDTGLTSSAINFFLVSAGFFAFVCCAQTQFRRMLIFGVFSSLSIAMASLATSSNEHVMHAAWAMAINTIIAAGAAFLCEDAIQRRIGIPDSSQMQGLATSMPVLGGFALVSLLEFVNAPLSWGFHAEEVAIGALFERSSYVGSISVFIWAVLTFALIRNFAKLFWGPANPKPSLQIDLNWSERWALLTLVVLIVLPL